MLKALLILLVITNIMFSVAIIFIFKKQLNQKDTQIKSLTEQLNSLKQTDRKKSFQLDVNQIECEFHILKIGNKKINDVKNRIGIGVISELNFTGLRFLSPYNLPIKNDVEVEITFEIDQHTFIFKGILLQKEEYKTDDKFSYQLQFIETDYKTEVLYNKFLRNEELKSKIGFK